MNAQEAAALLTVCASFDNRKPDRDTASAWSTALDDLRFTDCRDAVVQHYQRSREWIMPFDIITAVKRIRAKRLHDTPEPPPPPDLMPAETVQWLKVIRRRIANGEHVDATGRGELIARDLPELRALIQRREPLPDLEPLLAPEDHTREPLPATDQRTTTP